MSLPKNRSAEKAIIGSMLVERTAVRTAARYLTPSSFFHEDLRALFEGAMELDAADSPCDTVTLLERIRRGQKIHLFQPAGLEATVQSCSDAVVTAEHAEHYSKIVAACFFEREIISEAGKMVVAVGEKMDADLQPFLNKIRDLVLEKESLTAAMTFDYHRDMSGFANYMDDKKTAALNKTGIETIDSAWGGSRDGEVNVWGAAPNVGKSLMLLNIMDRTAAQGRRCLYVGTEMIAYETVERHLAIISGVSATAIRTRQLGDQDKKFISEAISESMRGLPISILDKPEPNLAQIESAISSTKAKVVFLDYLERFSLPKEKDMRLRVKEFMRSIKSMARRHDVEIHLASQLNRTTYGTIEKRPSLSDLSESSAVEKEADRVMLLWRPKSKQGGFGHAILECIQAKGRSNNFGGVIDLKLDFTSLIITEAQAGDIPPQEAK